MWSWNPDPYGAVAPNQNPYGLGTFIYNLRFPGQYYQAETALNYNYYRDYDPQTGRYLEPDRLGLLGGSFSTYNYANNNPIMYIDPFGLCWFYYQSTGTMLHVDDNGYADYAATGYAGYGAGVNNPGMQNVPFIGPLPQGNYTIQPQQNNGPLIASMVLIPKSSNQMFNRNNFLIHGPHANDHQNSSNGCPVLNKTARDQIGSSGDTCLKVMP